MAHGHGGPKAMAHGRQTKGKFVRVRNSHAYEIRTRTNFGRSYIDASMAHGHGGQKAMAHDRQTKGIEA